MAREIHVTMRTGHGEIANLVYQVLGLDAGLATGAALIIAAEVWTDEHTKRFGEQTRDAVKKIHESFNEKADITKIKF